MSLIKAIKAQLGLSGTPANNFTWDASSNGGATPLKLTRGDAVDVMTVDAAGKVGFSAGVLGFAFGTAATGSYTVLPFWIGSWVVQWGSGVTVGGVYDFNFPTAFTAIPIMLCSEANTAFASIGYLACGANSITQGRVTSSNGAGASSTAQKSVFWLAIGK